MRDRKLSRAEKSDWTFLFYTLLHRFSFNRILYRIRYNITNFYHWVSTILFINLNFSKKKNITLKFKYEKKNIPVNKIGG